MTKEVVLKHKQRRNTLYVKLWLPQRLPAPTDGKSTDDSC